MGTRPAPIWDLPTRVFHWSLPLLLVAAWASEELGRMDIHKWCGYTLLVLVGFRLAWGFVGSTHARFANFLRGPRAVLAYWRGERAPPEGHNPAGGWSVLAMLVLLLVQAITGLFKKDDIAFSGPLAHTVSSKLAGALGEWHEINFNILLGLVALHVGAVLLQLRRGRNLLRPMLDGGRSAGGARTTPSWVALALLAAVAAALWYLLSLVPKPQLFL